MSHTGWLQMVNRALASAQIPLADNDTDGACNRAYYAMFDAVHAALLAAGVTSMSKTHSGLMQLFSQHFVRTGKLPADFGRSLQRVHALRQ
jgi:uncharacterized protein (UPF0332 family)